MTGGQKNLQTLLGLSHADVWEVEETIRYVQSLSRPLKDSLRHILQRRNGAYGGSHIELKNTACIRHASARRESLAKSFFSSLLRSRDFRRRYSL